MVQVFLLFDTMGSVGIEVDDLDRFPRIDVGTLHHGDETTPVFLSHDLNVVLTATHDLPLDLDVRWCDSAVVWCRNRRGRGMCPLFGWPPRPSWL